MITLKSGINLFATVLTLVFYSSLTNAATIELVKNGEFENANVSSNGWAAISNLNGWSSSVGYSEVWGENASYNNQPEKGSDGLAHGKSHELTWTSTNEKTTQNVFIENNGLIDFSFDSWRRYSQGINYSLIGSLSGDLAVGAHFFTSNLWEKLGFYDLAVLAGETLSLEFSAIGGGGSGAHIDQVSILHTSIEPQLQVTSVPEPMTFILLILGFFCFIFSNQRKIKKTKGSFPMAL